MPRDQNQARQEWLVLVSINGKEHHVGPMVQENAERLVEKIATRTGRSAELVKLVPRHVFERLLELL